MELPQWFVPASCLVILICISTLFLRRDGKRKNLPPGPPGLPIIGHLHLMKPPIHRTLQNLSEKYGPVMFLRFGTLKVLVVSSPSAVEECFIKNDIVFANRPVTLAGKHLNYDYTTVGFSPYGDHWRGLRRLINQELFSVSRLAMLSDVRVDEVKILVKQLFERSGGSWTKVEVRHRFVDLIFDVMLRMISGKRYYGTDVVSKEATDFKNMMDEIFELINPAAEDLFPVLQRFDLFGVRKRMKQVAKKQDSFLQNLIDEHRRKRSSSSNNNGANQEKKTMTLIEVMLSLQETDPVFYCDTTIKGIAAAVVAAGTETSASTMEWILALLLNHPEVMEKLKAEIDTHVGKDRFIDDSDISKLTYLQSVVLETLRLYPAGALGVPHSNSEDCIIGGYHVPKGTMLMVNLWVLHKDPKHWKDATKFMPERFQNGSSEGYSLIPFGAGRRQCPGANLAKRIMALTIGSLVQAFEWKKIGDKQINMMEGDGLTLARLEPLVALIRPRQEMTPLLSGL
ncbi:hypothetical protein QN277_015433 [Acacia crassicarpa]|uniref:Cytochrome P450 n=1 Tax=Acacia crassicarpa TaxID=499986 RepID=A0AAE1MVF6_9FABA|nr:hypothetical protein QN277_015433 [Acacia crassicarpa]